MEHNSVSQVPLIGQGISVGNHHKIVGIGISFFIHAVAVYSVVFMGSVFSSFKPPLRIDFSIHQPYEVTTVQKLTTKVAHKQENVSAKVHPLTPPQKSLPEKVQVAKPKKIVPLATKKKMLAEIPTPAVEKEVSPESVKGIRKASAENLPEQVISSVESVDDGFDKSIAATVPAPGTDQEEIKPFSSPEKQYLKEHFLYIKNSIQNKISYPRMARKMGWQGRVLISFVVCKDGSVKDIQIIESSGFKALDKNAVEVIQKVAPFPKPPVSAELIIPVTYKLS